MQATSSEVYTADVHLINFSLQVLHTIGESVIAFFRMRTTTLRLFHGKKHITNSPRILGKKNFCNLYIALGFSAHFRTLCKLTRLENMFVKISSCQALLLPFFRANDLFFLKKILFELTIIISQFFTIRFQ